MLHLSTIRARVGRHVIVVVALAAAMCATARANTAGKPLVHARLFGGDQEESITGIAMMPNGRVAVCGKTSTQTLQPLAQGGLQSEHGGSEDAFVCVMSADLKTIHAWTFIGGTRNDGATALAVDTEGDIVVIGETESTNFPMIKGSIGQTYSAGIDGFIVKLSPGLDTLRFGCYINGSKDEHPKAVALDGTRSIFICGSTSSPSGFPLNSAYDHTHNGGLDGFIMKVQGIGSGIGYASYFGSEGDEEFTALCVPNNSAVIVTGYTTSQNYEIYPKYDPWAWPQPGRPYDWTYNGGTTDAIVTKFMIDGGGLIFSTFFGGNDNEVGRGIAVDSRNRVMVVGETTSPDLPMVSGLQTAFRGGKDIFLAQLTEDGKTLVGSTYYGGRGDDVPTAIAMVNQDVCLIAGSTTSRDIESMGAGSTGQISGATDAFLLSLNTSTQFFATLMGWQNTDQVLTICKDSGGDVYLGGLTSSPSVVAADGTFQNAGEAPTTDGFVVKYAFGFVQLTTPRGGQNLCAENAISISWTTEGMPTNQEYSVVLLHNDVEHTVITPRTSANSVVWTPPMGLDPNAKWAIAVRSTRGHLSYTEPDLTIMMPSHITRQPSSAQACPGSSVTFSIETDGTAPRYQWRRNGAVINGATGNVLTVVAESASQAGTYDVLVNGACGVGQTSQPATLSIGTGVSIVREPADVTVDAGKPIRLAVEARGDQLVYRWEKDGMVLPAHSGATLDIPSASVRDSGSYRCFITSRCGDTATRVVVVKVNGTVSVTDGMEIPAIAAVHPNPASGRFTVSMNSVTDGTIHLRLLDMTGRTLWEHAGSGETTDMDVDVRHLAAGTYYLMVDSGIQRSSLRIVIVN